MSKIKPGQLISIIGLILVPLIGVSLLVIGQGDNTYKITARVASAGNLSIGDEVRMSGMPIGRITDILKLDNSWRLTAEVGGKVKIPQGSSVRVTTKLPGNKAALEVFGGTDGNFLPVGKTVILHEGIEVPKVTDGKESEDTKSDELVLRAQKMIEEIKQTP